MDYGIKAIPTEINGVRYRSRIEAKYAEFFRLIGWDVKYEPFDIDGWTPDFMIMGKCYPNNPILIEVKPFISPDVIREQVKRVANARGCFIILVGEAPYYEGDYGGYLSFGKVIRQPESKDGLTHFDIDADWKDISYHRFDIGSNMFLFDGIIYDDNDYRKNFIDIGSSRSEEIINIWNMACSNVQYIHNGKKIY